MFSTNNLFSLPASTSDSPNYINLKDCLYPSSDDEDLSKLDATENTNNYESIRFRGAEFQVGTAYFDYKAKEKDEISLKRGSLVEIINPHCEDGWILAQVDNKQGMVPKNYIFLVGNKPNVIQSNDIEQTTFRIGTGGFADVFKGKFNNKAVALKVPRCSLKTKEAKVKEVLEREALVFCRLNHKNIVHFYGICFQPLLLVLELCEGGTLFSLCRKMKKSHVPTAINWAKQVASAMHYLHNRDNPFIHADLKADNVLIKEKPCECNLLESGWTRYINQYNNKGICNKCNSYCLNNLTLKITDFGLSRSLKSQRKSFSGSVSWMAPEVIEKNDYSKQSDVWSFGVFLWEILSCRIPFSNYNCHIIMFAIVKRDKTLSLPQTCPQELQNIFQLCWRKNALDRPSFFKLITMLDNIQLKILENMTWFLETENDTQKQSTEETVTFKEIERQFKDGKLWGLKFLQAAQNSFKVRNYKEMKAPIPAARNLLNRKFDKGDIGGPIGLFDINIITYILA